MYRKQLIFGLFPYHFELKMPIVKWDFQKDSMYTSRPNAISEGFSKNQIKIINRMIEEKIRNYMENQNYDYYGN